MTTTIKQTTDYSLFKHLPGNRKVKNTNVERLKKSMTKHYFLSPVQVDRHFRVIDGQHRIEACRQLGLPVYYYITEGDLTTVQTLNSCSEDWKTEDYLESHITTDKKDYKIYKEIYDNYKLPHRILLAILSGNLYYHESLLEEFRIGNFKIVNLDQATSILSKISECKLYYEGATRRNFIFAFLKCLKNKEFTSEEFITKLKLQPTKMVDCTTINQYLNLIEEIYNFKRPKNKRIALRIL